MEERTPVQVGVDLRPIPLNLSDGESYPFNADPPKHFFSETERLAKEMQKDKVDKWDVVDRMREVLADQIVDEERRAAFMKHEYGFAVLGSIAKTYAEQVVALPTQSPSGSGKKRG
jgi:hypothetical protein